METLGLSLITMYPSANTIIVMLIKFGELLSKKVGSVQMMCHISTAEFYM